MAIVKSPWTCHADRTRWIAGLVAAATVLAGPAARAQQASTSSSRDTLVRQATERFAQTRAGTPTPNPGDQRSPAGRTLSLTIDDAVKMALDKNLDIAVQRLNPQMYEFSLASIKAAYLPTITSLIGDQHQ